MKKILLTSKLLLGAGIILLSLNSCKNETKQEDPKEVAEDQNEAKFDDSNSKENDSEFLVGATEINLEEIAIGQLAQQKSTNPEIKKFGKMLVDDHTKLSGEVKTVAQARNFSLPTSITEDGQEKYNKLNEKSGVDFDKKFVDMMVDGHEKAIDKFTKASKNSTDEEIKTWASNNIASLTAHLQHAKMLKQELDKK
jgi:putative membrane protein